MSWMNTNCLNCNKYLALGERDTGYCAACDPAIQQAHSGNTKAWAVIVVENGVANLTETYGDVEVIIVDKDVSPEPHDFDLDDAPEEIRETVLKECE